LYHTDNIVYPYSHSDTSNKNCSFDCGNIAARGNSNECKVLVDVSMEKLRKMTEKCDNLQGFTQIYSTSGGTGGVAAQFIRNLSDNFPKKQK